MAANFRLSSALLLSLLLAVTTALAQSPLFAASPSSSPEEARLSSFLRSYLQEPPWGPPADTDTQVRAVWLRGNGRLEEVVVYLSGGGWCGSGGCTMLVLLTDQGRFRKIGYSTIVHLPVRLLPTTSHGRPDIGVMVCGGGIIHCYEAKLSFDGKKYPLNPSMPPAEKLMGRPGKIIIARGSQGALLYPGQQ